MSDGNSYTGICRYCSMPVIDSDAVDTFSYWQGEKFVSHKQCKKQGELQEAFDCQVIDSDCNDCSHYRRGKLAPKLVEQIKKPDGTMVEVTFQAPIFVGGHCLKFDRPTLARPMSWTGLECFEHRRSK